MLEQEPSLKKGKKKLSTVSEDPIVAAVTPASKKGAKKPGMHKLWNFVDFALRMGDMTKNEISLCDGMINHFSDDIEVSSNEAVAEKRPPSLLG